MKLLAIFATILALAILAMFACGCGDTTECAVCDLLGMNSVQCQDAKAKQQQKMSFQEFGDIAAPKERH